MKYPNLTEGVKNILGNPKKAIVKLSFPMIIGMAILSVYQLADGIWVAGLGSDELAAVGLFFPFFLAIMAIGNGLGMGGSSAISRKIGENKKKVADSIAIHTIVLGIIVGILITVIFLPLTDILFSSISDSQRVGVLSSEYAKILFSGSIIIIFPCVANAVLRGEGDAKKAMYGLMVGSFANIILDPFFIYTLNLGVAGAAWATVFSLFLSVLIFVYWLFIKKSSFLYVTFKAFKFKKDILKDIFRVGVPSAMTQISVSVSLFLLNIIVNLVGGDDGVAVLTSGWRVLMMGVIPLLGIGPAVTVVTGAAYGSNNKSKLVTGYLYAIKIGLVIELFIAAVIFIFASEIAFLFSYSIESSIIFDDIVYFLRITAIYYPIMPFGVLTASMFRGIGHGTKSLVISVLRAIILQTTMAYILSVNLGFGLAGVWIGMVLGAFIAITIAFIWGKITIENIFKK